MSDPFKIFSEDPGKRETLKLIWPDLHAVLNKHVNDRRRTPPQCAAAAHATPQLATGRLSLNGTPACSMHIRMHADRDLGYPLDIVDPANGSGDMLIRHAETFGPALRQMRESIGISQAELARRAGVAASRISKYETRYKLPDFDTMAKILKPLGGDICVLPLQAAKTQREREDVIIAGRAVQAGSADHQALYAALGRLAAAEIASGEDFDSPYETIRELHDELVAKEREIRALRQAISAVGAALGEVRIR